MKKLVRTRFSKIMPKYKANDMKPKWEIISRLFRGNKANHTGEMTMILNAEVNRKSQRVFDGRIHVKDYSMSKYWESNTESVLHVTLRYKDKEGNPIEEKGDVEIGICRQTVFYEYDDELFHFDPIDIIRLIYENIVYEETR